VQAVASDTWVCFTYVVDINDPTTEFSSSGSIRGGHGSPCRSDRYFTLLIIERGLISSHSDTGLEKKKLCLELGAEKWIDFKEAKDTVQAVREACDGEGAHCAIVTTADASGYTQAVDYLRPGGTLMAVGLPGEAKLEASIFFTVFKVGSTMKDLTLVYSRIVSEHQHHWFICW
jgi:threonine dehydrogenase-like Zn-dependent dehydrogenase